MNANATDTPSAIDRSAIAARRNRHRHRRPRSPVGARNTRVENGGVRTFSPIVTERDTRALSAHAAAVEPAAALQLLPDHADQNGGHPRWQERARSDAPGPDPVV